MYQTIRYEKNEKIGVLTISRPAALNALNSLELSEINAAIAEVEADKDLGCLIITGDGKAFVAGADISEMSTMTLTQGRDFGRYGAAVMRRIEKLEIPTIAAVNGFALGGGCELAMSCDIILASEKAKCGQPEVGLGITPGFSGTQRLPRRVGTAKAKESGLVNEVFAPEALMEGAMAMAQSFVKNAPIAVKYSTACIDRGMQIDIDGAIALENELFAMCFATADQKEGMAAFVEKRAATFENK